MLINKLKPEHLEKLEAIKNDYPTSYEQIHTSLSENKFILDISYGVFLAMRNFFGDKHSAYDFFKD